MTVLDSIKNRLSGVSNNGKIILGIVIVLVLIVIIIVPIVISKSSHLASPSTVASTKKDRIASLTKVIEPIVGKKKNLYELPGLPDNMSLLLNYNLIGCRLSGYLDPLQDGVFAEEDAVRLALNAGCRLFILEISNDTNGNPALVARDSTGIKRSLNNGSINKVCTALTGAEKGSDPIIVVLYFNNTPNKTTEPEKYLMFLSQVARALEPLNTTHIGLTSVGDFTRQKKASELFTFAPEFYKQKTIILCNADTSPFRNPGQLGVTRKFLPAEDLDFLVHARISKPDGVGIMGVTETVPGSKIQIVDESYLLLTPPDKVASAVDMIRNTFTIVMKRDPNYNPSKDVSKILFETYGVNCTPVCMNTLAVNKSNSTYTPKNQPLRFIKPAPIVPTVPNRKLDANGGSVITPKL